MSEIKLLALDLDGTLFTKDKQVTAENRAALKAAEAKGVHVVIKERDESRRFKADLCCI